MRTWTWTALLAVDSVVAITAVLGGFALATGLERDRFPLEWLQGTPFDSYVVPGLILTVVVGGTATVATLALLREPGVGGRASVLAGVVVIVWIVGEILVLTRDDQLISPIEVLYLALGLAMVALGFAVGRRGSADRAEPRVPTSSGGGQRAGTDEPGVSGRGGRAAPGRE